MNALELEQLAGVRAGTLPAPSRRGVRADGEARQTYNARLGTASWVARMKAAQREARAACTRKTSVGRLVDELYEHATSFGDLRDKRARSVIGGELGGRCPDAVRRAAASAMRLGEVFIDECKGDQKRRDGQPWRGKPTNVYVLTRALALIPHMPAAARAAHLADPSIQRAIAWLSRQADPSRPAAAQAPTELRTAPQTHEDRPSEALAAVPSSAPPPAVTELRAPPAAAVEESRGCEPKPDNLSRTGREIVSPSFKASSLFPVSEITAPPENDRPPPSSGDGAAPDATGPVCGVPAAPCPDGAGTGAPGDGSRLEPRTDDRRAESSPSGFGATSCFQAHDARGAVDPASPSVERRQRRSIAAALVPFLGELERLALAPAPAEHRSRPRLTPDDQARARAELLERAATARAADAHREAERLALWRLRIERARDLDRLRAEAADRRTAAAAAAARSRELLEALPRLLSPGEVLQLRAELEAAAAAAGCELCGLSLLAALGLYPDAAAPWLDVVASRLGGVQ